MNISTIAMVVFFAVYGLIALGVEIPRALFIEGVSAVVAAVALAMKK